MTDDDFLNFIVPWSFVMGQATTAFALWLLANDGAATAGWCALGGVVYAAIRTWQIRRAIHRRKASGGGFVPYTTTYAPGVWDVVIPPEATTLVVTIGGGGGTLANQARHPSQHEQGRVT